MPRAAQAAEASVHSHNDLQCCIPPRIRADRGARILVTGASHVCRSREQAHGSPWLVLGDVLSRRSRSWRCASMLLRSLGRHTPRQVSNDMCPPNYSTQIVIFIPNVTWYAASLARARSVCERHVTRRVRLGQESRVQALMGSASPPSATQCPGPVHMNNDAALILMRRGASQSPPHRFEFERHHRIDGRKHACRCRSADIGQCFAATGTRTRQDVPWPVDTRADDAIAEACKNGQDSEPTERPDRR